ncbi:MAG: alpha/beta hydrolase [Pseudomonadota bacterium]
MLWFILFLLILVGIYFIPTWLERRRVVIDRAARAGAPGKFAKLSQGVTHYRWIGPVRGPVAVMIHGLTTGSPVWDDLAETMADMGYRVLVYDLYNRGYSDNAEGQHDIDFYLRQLDDLLEDQGLEDSLTMVGYSMGGMIATAFAATEPHRMSRLVIIAPGGVEITENQFSQYCRTNPVIGDWVHGIWGEMRFRRQINEDSAAAQNPRVLQAQAMELGRRGFLPAVLACRRGILQAVQEQEHRAITRDGIPTIAIWGEKDSVIPVSAMGKMAQWNRKAHHEVIEGADHALPYSHSKEVGDVLRKMIREQPLI